jgi:flagellar hook assembly protein FlgD
VITGIEEENQAVPREFFIAQNYPNPFNPRTTLSYGLPRDSEVRIDIFNVLGQRVLTLVDEYQTAGFKSVVWDGQDSGGGKVSSGVYFYTIEAGEYHDSKKMLLIK